MLDVANGRCQRTFIVINDPTRHVLRRQTVVGPDDCNDGDPYVRENICGRAQRGSSTENEDQDRENGERIRPLQSYENNRIHSCERPGFSALTSIMGQRNALLSVTPKSE